jgi:predicted RNase H-like nuclease (RuvC/YqgF family)
METKTNNQTADKGKTEQLNVVKPLKHSTSQKRVELIEKQKWELIAATATIGNQIQEIKHLKTAVSALENSLGIKQRTISDLESQFDKLGESSANLLTIKMKNEATIKDLTERNDNLKRITNDQNERIEWLQTRIKNHETLIEEFNVENKWLKNEGNNFNTINKQLRLEISELKESHNTKVSKLTNWIIFLVLAGLGNVAMNFYQLLTN